MDDFLQRQSAAVSAVAALSPPLVSFRVTWLGYIGSVAWMGKRGGGGGGGGLIRDGATNGGNTVSINSFHLNLLYQKHLQIWQFSFMFFTEVMFERSTVTFLCHITCTCKSKLFNDTC